MIRVVSVRGMNSPLQRLGVTYVGRPFAGWPGHPLANPFRPNSRGELGPCLDRYRDHVLAMPDLNAKLAALWAECEQGAKPLGCWCCDATLGDGQPVVCHAQIVAALLAGRYLSGGQPCPPNC